LLACMLACAGLHVLRGMKLTICHKVTRSHKANGKNHAGIAEGTVLPVEHGPKFFGKNGFEGVDPKKTKKNGCGKGNW